MAVFCFGVKIILNDKDDPVSQNLNIGLYNVTGDNSELRWAQSNLYGHTWTDGMIVAGGLSSFTTEIDLKNGGSAALPGSGSVTVTNTGKFWKELQDRNIILTGLRLEIWVLVQDEESPYEEGDYRIRTYYCQEPEWDSKVFKIPFKGGQEKRKANIALQVNSISFPYASVDTCGDTIPAVFGRLFPKYDVNGKITRSTIAKGIKVSDYEKIYSNDVFEETGAYPEINEFPVEYVDGTDHTSDKTLFYIKIRGRVKTILETPGDVYLYVSDGAGKGQYRKVLQWQNEYIDELSIFVDSYFGTAIQDKDGADPSWIKFLKIKKDFYFDHFPCKDYLDLDGNAIENNPELYTIVDEKLERALDYAYSSEGVVENNKAEIKPLLYSDNLETIDSMIIRPVESIYLNTATDLSAWNTSTLIWSNFTYVDDGVYVKKSDLYSYGTPVLDINFSSPNISNIYDKNYCSSIHFEVTQHTEDKMNYYDYHKSLCFAMPEQPKKNWDSLLIGIRMKSMCFFPSGYFPNGFPDTETNSSVRIMLRRWQYGVKSILQDTIVDESYEVDGAEFYTIPDLYFTTSPDLENRGYFSDPVEPSPYSEVYGQYAFDNITPENYDSFVEGVIMLYRHLPFFAYEEFADHTWIFELCLIFKKEGQDISKEILTPFAGRVFNDTWNGRKTSTNLIQHPVDILEHACRLQNWSDYGAMPVSGWGLQYSDDALIATTQYGSFDDPDLIAAKKYLAANQILDYDDSTTDEIKATLCNDFNLANWQDGDGYERVIDLQNGTGAVYTVQLQDILDRSSIKVSKLSQDKIVSEPFVRYNYNPASQEYDDQISILNSSASSFSQNYTVGIQDAAKAEELWNSCHSLYLMCNQINMPNTKKTDLKWANSECAYSIALDYLENWINWQFNEEIEFKSHFNICASWDLCTPFNVLLSHQTDNVSRRALVEEVEMNPNPPYDIFIKAVLYA
jgi:hypothetical protein